MNENRFKKSKDQIAILEKEFEVNPNWNKTQMKNLASNLDLKIS